MSDWHSEARTSELPEPIDALKSRKAASDSAPDPECAPDPEREPDPKRAPDANTQ